MLVMCACRTESEHGHRQETDRVTARKAFADELATRLRSVGGQGHREPLRAATNGQAVTFAAPSVLQVSCMLAVSQALVAAGRYST